MPFHSKISVNMKPGAMSGVLTHSTGNSNYRFVALIFAGPTLGAGGFTVPNEVDNAYLGRIGFKLNSQNSNATYPNAIDRFFLVRASDGYIFWNSANTPQTSIIKVENAFGDGDVFYWMNVNLSLDDNNARHFYVGFGQGPTTKAGPAWTYGYTATTDEANTPYLSVLSKIYGAAGTIVQGAKMPAIASYAHFPYSGVELEFWDGSVSREYEACIFKPFLAELKRERDYHACIIKPPILANKEERDRKILNPKPLFLDRHVSTSAKKNYVFIM